MCSPQLSPFAPPAQVMATLATELSDVLDRIADAAAGGVITGVRGPALVELAETLWAGADRARAVAVHATGELHGSGDLLVAGYGSTGAWLRKSVRLGTAESGGVLAQVRAVRSEFGPTWQAWNAAQISGAAAREITIGLTALYKGFPAAQRAQELPVAEEILIGVATTRPVADVRRVLDTLKATVDPDAGLAAVIAAYDDQSLSSAQVGEMFCLTGHLTKESNALLLTALEAIIDGWHRSGSLPPEDQPTSDGTPDGDDADQRAKRRRRPHLLALALAELARRQMENADLGSRHDVKPHVTITVDVDTLAADLPGDLLIPGRTDPVQLPAESVRRILCDADITTAVTTHAHGTGTGRDGDADGDGVDAGDLATWLRAESRTVLYVGRTKRTAPPRLRTALEVRDRHCAFPDCRIDPTRCEAHHVTYWRHHGSTDLDNLILLCTRHHHLVHEGGWQLHPTPGKTPGSTGYWDITPPERPRWP